MAGAYTLLTHAVLLVPVVVAGLALLAWEDLSYSWAGAWTRRESRGRSRGLGCRIVSVLVQGPKRMSSCILTARVRCSSGSIAQDSVSAVRSHSCRRRQGVHDQRRRNRLRRACDRSLFRRSREPGNVHRRRRAEDRRSSGMAASRSSSRVWKRSSSETSGRAASTFTTSYRGRPGGTRSSCSWPSTRRPAWPARPT